MLIINKTKDFATIYLRYLNNSLIYIGESSSFIKARHARDDINAGDFDKIRVLKAPTEQKRRKYWEAYLICKLKPIKQRAELYKYLVERGNGREFKKSKYKLILLEDKMTKKQLLYSAYLNLERFKEYINMYRKAK